MSNRSAFVSNTDIQPHDSASSRPSRLGKASFALGLIGPTVCAFQAGECAEQNGAARFRDYADGPLTAKDFQSPIPGFVKLPGQKASVKTDLRYDFRYSLYRSRRFATARLSSIEIRAVVVPAESWNREPEDSRLTDHEQGHFDLTYIAALRARLSFSTSKRLVGSGADNERAVKDLQQQLDDRFRLLTEELLAAHVEYDECRTRALTRVAIIGGRHEACRLSID